MKVVSSLIRGKVEITDASGNTIKEFPYNINVAKVADQVASKRIEISKLSQSGDPESIGKAVVELFDIIFGESTTKDMLEFYENDYTTMLVDIVPVLTDEIYPAFDAARTKAIALRKHAKH